MADKKKPIKDLTDDELMQETKKALGPDKIAEIIREIPAANPDKDNRGGQ